MTMLLEPQTLDMPVAAAGSLDDLLSGTWEDLRAAQVAFCPVCDGELVAHYFAGTGVVGGRCGGCGSTLS